MGVRAVRRVMDEERNDQVDWERKDTRGRLQTCVIFRFQVFNSPFERQTSSSDSRASTESIFLPHSTSMLPEFSSTLPLTGNLGFDTFRCLNGLRAGQLWKAQDPV